MSKGKWAVVLAGVVVLAAVAAAYAAGQAKREGTDWKELAARKPPSPERIAVAVMPFAAPAALGAVLSQTELERQVELPRACVLLNLQRHRFRIIPDAQPLVRVPPETDRAMQLTRDEKLRLSGWKEEALKAGRGLGADWVIYGEWTLRQDFRVKTGLFVRRPVKKQVRLSLHLVLADVKSGEVFYWVRLQDEARGSSTVTGFGATDEDRGIARSMLVSLTNAAFDDIAKALPKHEVGPEVTREQLDKLIGAMGW
jgi:hypothetical protein